MVKDPAKVKAKLDAETRAFRKSVNQCRRYDGEFSRPDDEPLTNEEIAEIDAFWGKYHFAYPDIDYASFQNFKNRYGHFNVLHCPRSISLKYFAPHFVNKDYRLSFQNKTMLGTLYPDISQPKAVIRRVNGLFFNSHFAPVSIREAAEICLRHIKEKGDLIYKPNGTSGGKGIKILNAEFENLDSIGIFLSRGSNTYAIQEVIKQCSFMASLNDSSVNTIRITTLLFDGKVRVLAAVIRIGKQGNVVDNWHAGGSIIGVDINSGQCNDWALANDNSRLTVLPSGLDLKARELFVPNFEGVKTAVIRSHYRIPYIKMISWDIALDETNVPIMLECNFTGMVQLHEATTGPIFGDLMPELLDEYLLRRFYLRFATDDFICKEYYNHIVIAEYIGSSDVVTVPKTIREKPVTRIEPSAFKGCKITQFDAPENVIKNSPSAVNAVKALIAKISTPPPTHKTEYNNFRFRTVDLRIIILYFTQSISARFILAWNLSDFVGEEM